METVGKPEGTEGMETTFYSYSCWLGKPLNMQISLVATEPTWLSEYFLGPAAMGTIFPWIRP